MGHRLLSETSYGQRQPQNAVQHDIQELTEREAELADPYQPRRPGRNQRRPSLVVCFTNHDVPQATVHHACWWKVCWAIGFAMHTWLCQVVKGICGEENGEPDAATAHSFFWWSWKIERLDPLSDSYVLFLSVYRVDP